MKQLVVNCDFNGLKSPVEFFYGTPSEQKHPLHYQMWYIMQFRGGTCAQEFVAYTSELHEKAKKNKIAFEEFCYENLKTEYKPSIGGGTVELNELSLEAMVEILFKKITSFIYIMPSDRPDFFGRLLKAYKEEKAKYFILGLNAEKNDNMELAVEFYRKADNHYDARAVRKMAYLENNAANAEKKISAILQSMILGDSESLYHLVVGLDTSTEYERVLTKLKESCERLHNNARSLMILGILALIFDSNSTRAMDYFEKASGFKYPSSFFYIGLMYERGLGATETNMKRAVQYYEMAANFNHFYAIQKLLEINSIGSSSYPFANAAASIKGGRERIDKSSEHIVLYSQKIAPLDHSLAFMHLAFHYWHGDDDVYDAELAREYAEKALFCHDPTSGVNQLDSSCIADLYELLGYYHYYCKNKNEKCLEYFLRAIKAGKPMENLAVVICKYFKSVAGKSSGAKQREYYENLVCLGEGLIGSISDEEKVPYYLLGKTYARGLKRSLVRAKNYLSKAFDYHKSMVLADFENENSPDFYRIGKILDLNLLNKPTEDCLVYYQRATKCKPKSFLARLYKHKASEQLERILKKTRRTVQSIVENYDFNEYSKEKPYVMISYADENKDFAILIRNALETREVTALLDSRGCSEKTLRDSVLYVENASILMACLSEQYEKSDYCEKELRYAVSTAKKSVIPVIVQGEYVPNAWLAEVLVDQEYHDVSSVEALNAALPSMTESIEQAILDETVKVPICKLS